MKFAFRVGRIGGGINLCHWENKSLCCPLSVAETGGREGLRPRVDDLADQEHIHSSLDIQEDPQSRD